ncbi:uncharacterized protein LOC119399679 isoform X2 [Rhipicephalus sanguineus]|nr:uncharacterized protein LOC119399679 isoform X2 [Rhipicephalus sanguineus]
MNVNYTREGFSSVIVNYTLSMWSGDQKCFVLIRNNDTSGEVQCELHVWSSSWRGNHSSCDMNYEELCGKAQGPEVFSEHECM